ncbi:hypothetical protein HCU74_04005 [Spongiibacter sp. KMU-166]|uniref:Uncharacterized protein n=1 Tax=Spongiibacter thalassae TaxID=2721624 RepID=A0ABX1GDL5_9GAMM|nr:hypothetical protein [Spongiibacter thalassae]NKI16582.1 hypothetical protein [Spongiibacter thalassae]
MPYQRFSAWCGPAFDVFFISGWCFIAGLFPPQAATASGAEIAAFYADGTNNIRAGLLLAMASCTLYIPWVVVISAQMKRIKNVSPLLVQTQNLSGTAGLLFFLIPVMIWLTATFRPERDPELILLINDLGWLMFTITFAPFVCQLFAFALAVLGDNSENPLFPRWAAYFNFWVAVSFIPAMLIIYFKTGPFAWTGLIGLWIPLILFSVWIWVMFYLLLKAMAKPDPASAT